MFNSNNNGYSLADIAAATGNGSNGNGNSGWGFGDGAGGWWIILLFIVFFAGGWGGYSNGYGGGSGNGMGGGTPQFVSAMDTDYLAQGLRDIQAGLASNFLTLNNENLSGVCDIRGDIASSTAAVTAAVTNGFNTQNLANLQNTNAIQRDIYSGTVGAMQNTQALQSTLAQMMSDNRADTAQLSYNQATNTCALQTANANNTRDIIDAINGGNQMLANMMQQNKVEAMQDKINDLTAQLQTARFAASQAAQTNDIVDQIKPLPVPAYQVSNPWAGCNCGGYTGCNMANI